MYHLTQEAESLLLRLLRCDTSNPPGNTGEAISIIADFLEAANIPFIRVEPYPGRVSLLARVLDSADGPHLHWNAHVDTFPGRRSAEDEVHVSAGAVHGRGAVDMKGGLVAFLMAARAIKSEPDGVPVGSLSLSVVADEETFGPFGSKYLIENEGLHSVDAVLSTEPSSLGVVRHGERGHLWTRVEAHSIAGHGAYPEAQPGAIDRVADFVLGLRETIRGMNDSLAMDTTLASNQTLGFDDHIGAGAARTVQSYSLNVGKIQGGQAVNLKARVCHVECDIRVPVGGSVDAAEEAVRMAARDGGFHVTVLSKSEPNVTDPQSMIVKAAVDAVTEVVGSRPVTGIGLGCTDMRLWRVLGVPACVVGPSPKTMGSDEGEFIELSELAQLTAVVQQTTHAYFQQWRSMYDRAEGAER